MLSEHQWRRGARLNLLLGAAGLLLALLSQPFALDLGAAHSGTGFGLAGAALAMYFALYRKPRRAPDEAAKEKITRREPALARLTMAGLCLITLAFIVLAVRDAGLIDLALWQMFALTALCGIGLLTAMLGAIPLLHKMRMARSDPALFDEREEALHNLAMKHGFSAMLSAAAIGGALHFALEIDISTWVAFYGPALIGLLAMQWQMVKAQPLGEAE